ncbi:hypothetical protein A2U01_0016014 [Trifolium medium]|uniref:Uncharacterized protein n=1 Tax=Trifolium medium TaxID=97028 RepID=A0A392N5M0_9FABA|nr:hypothetical protein [Trifolium medium]
MILRWFCHLHLKSRGDKVNWTVNQIHPSTAGQVKGRRKGRGRCPRPKPLINGNIKSGEEFPDSKFYANSFFVKGESPRYKVSSRFAKVKTGIRNSSLFITRAGAETLKVAFNSDKTTTKHQYAPTQWRLQTAKPP